MCSFVSHTRLPEHLIICLSVKECTMSREADVMTIMEFNGSQRNGS